LPPIHNPWRATWLLAAFLLDISDESQMKTHPLRGALFENFVVSEFLKNRFNNGQTDNLFFFRDNTGNEVDLIRDHGQKTDAVEVKSAQRVASDFFKGLRFFSKLSGNVRRAMVIYGGDGSYVRENFQVTGWRDIGAALK
jgi:uncharacterized protein